MRDGISLSLFFKDEKTLMLSDVDGTLPCIDRAGSECQACPSADKERVPQLPCL